MADAKEKAEKTEKTKVRVIVPEGETLGPLLLKRGDVTSDERYVKLLGTERGKSLVQEVKK